MVIVKIGDGLGNQIYNYVCGYSVAKHDKDTLMLDTSDVDNSTFREYGLDKFNIEYTRRESFSNKSFFHKVYKRLRRNIKYDVIFESREENFPQDMNVYRKRRFRNKYLHGYFQNICYFNSCREEIMRQFTPKEPLPDTVTQLMEGFGSSNTCSLHIRGGDISPLPLDYYRRAVDLCGKEQPDVQYIVFSNVHELAEGYVKELGINAKCIWEYGSFRDIDELFLMRSCQRHILSDSTFSRWGALLDDKEGTVYAVYTDEEKKIYPAEWVRVYYQE